MEERKNEQNININNSSNVRLGNTNQNIGRNDSQQSGNQKQEEKSFENLKQLVAKLKLQEVIDYLINNVDLAEVDKNVLYGLTYRINMIKRKLAQSIISSEQENVEMNKIASTLLQFIDNLNQN